MKKSPKIFLLVLLVLCAFVAGLYCNFMKTVWKSVTFPRIYSDTEVRERIGHDIPETAHHLYYSSRGFVDAAHYAAFSLNSKEEFEKFLKVNTFGSEVEIKECTELPKNIAKSGPDTWEGKYKDRNWSLAGKKFLLVKGTGSCEFMAYVPEENRVYIKLW